MNESEREIVDNTFFDNISRDTERERTKRRIGEKYLPQAINTGKKIRISWVFFVKIKLYSICCDENINNQQQQEIPKGKDCS